MSIFGLGVVLVFVFVTPGPRVHAVVVDVVACYNVLLFACLVFP
jgi:hypothetical protein